MASQDNMNILSGDHPEDDVPEAARRRIGGTASAAIAAVCLAVSGALITGAAVGSGEAPDAASAGMVHVGTGKADTGVKTATAPDETVSLAALPDAAAETAPLSDGTTFETTIEETAKALALPPEPQETVRVLTVGKGDTLMAMLTGEGVDRGAAHKAITAMSEVFSPRKLKPGQELHVTLLPQPVEEADAGKKTGNDLLSLHLPESPVRDVRVARLDDGGYKAEAVDKPTVSRPSFSSGTIQTSLYEAALAGGMPPKVLAQMIQVFSFDIDFQREIRQGDQFAILYDTVLVEDEVVGNGAIQVAEMTVRGKPRRYYRFKDEHGFWDYFDEKGRSVRKALLRTPIDGARISSGYGKRKHPILGYTKMHKGTDFAAPTGTPIYAAGDGTVEAAGRNGAYGKYIRIRHNSTYKTAYAHLSRIKVGKGKRVRQGQVIGLVGSTGRSTGPHLHYEVHLNGKQTNPLSVKLPTGKTLKGAQLAAFKKRRAELDTRYAALEAKTQVAKND